MEEEIRRLLDAFDAMGDEANVNACFGESVTVDGRTVIPVAKVGYGFGVGAGQCRPWKEGESGTGPEGMPAGGGGATCSPVGYIEVTESETRVEPVLDRQTLAIVGMLAGAWTAFWLSRAAAAIFGSSD